VTFVAPVRKQRLAQPFFVRRLEETGRDNLVGVDVVDRQSHNLAGKGLDRFHQAYSRTNSRASLITPLIAVAAAVSGLARNVRPPLPCRPSKLRLLVLTAYCPG